MAHVRRARALSGISLLCLMPPSTTRFHFSFTT